MRVRHEELRMLDVLSHVQQGASAYYRQLRLSSDPILAVGAWCALLDNRLAPRAFWDELVSFCRYAAVRRRAFKYFQDALEPDYARRVAEASVDLADIEQTSMKAVLSHDGEAAAQAEAQLYLASGDLEHLHKAATNADSGGGWRPALEWAARAVAIAPLNPLTVQRLLVLLDNAANPDLLEEAVDILARAKVHLQVGQVFLASVALSRGDAALCLKRLEPFDDAKSASSPALAPYLGLVRTLRASAREKLSDYRRAYADFVALNQSERSPTVDAKSFYQDVTSRAALVVPTLPTTMHPEVVQMLGFPRAGTTLLETVLTAHPLVEAFEEIPSFGAALSGIDSARAPSGSILDPERTFATARARYYQQITSWRRKSSAEVLVDKDPIRSAYAVLMRRLFPEWRYIFCIRHPFDVVLSCFKQRFIPNPAMENFRSIDDAAKLYDFTMTQWFREHTLEDADVHYVRYEDLVTKFDQVTADALAFLGVGWDDSVLHFGETAANRAKRTPSYQKVRQGLSLGVQTQWRNYRFAFESEGAKPLFKWSEFFGYGTQ